MRSGASGAQTVTHSASPFTSSHKHTQGISKIVKWVSITVSVRSSSINAGMPHTRLLKLSRKVFLFSHVRTLHHVRKRHRRLTPQFFIGTAGLIQLGQQEQIPEPGFLGLTSKSAVTNKVGLCLHEWDDILFIYAFSYRSKCP